ncbi:MAG: delta-aminolevulinic acid dehydratase [Pyrinomonadaceae bacterium]
MNAMNALNAEKIYDELFAWCETENFAGYDPFDGLNSRIFQATPLKFFASARLAWLQMVKRSSDENLRPRLKIEKGVNSKGIALFALAELARFRATSETKHAENAKKLLEKLLALKIEIQNPKSQIQNRAAFGYNFDWQSRAFFAPKNTPTIVPTAFAARAFLEAYALFKTPEYLATAQEICRFIITDLNRPFESSEEICFSYTPLDRSVIFNASLLAGETLASFGALTGNWECANLAKKSARFVARRQRADGAWAYGAKFRHQWIDNFHTAYILLSLFRLQKTIPNLRDEVSPAIEAGLNFWLDNFFLADGIPKYYDKQTFPIDIHSASAAIVALCELDELDARRQPLAEKVAAWTIENMRDADGFFYYQKRKSQIIKTPFMRWAQAWTALAIARLLEVKRQ